MLSSPVVFFLVACRRLIRHAFEPHELPSLTEAILSDENVEEMVRCLPVNDAQVLVDAIDEACSLTRYLGFVDDIDAFCWLDTGHA